MMLPITESYLKIRLKIFHAYAMLPKSKSHNNFSNIKIMGMSQLDTYY